MVAVEDVIPQPCDPLWVHGWDENEPPNGDSFWARQESLPHSGHFPATSALYHAVPLGAVEPDALEANFDVLFEVNVFGFQTLQEPCCPGPSPFPWQVYCDTLITEVGQSRLP
jgi:hypothetical protein